MNCSCNFLYHLTIFDRFYADNVILDLNERLILLRLNNNCKLRCKSVSKANNEFIVGTPKSNNSYRRIYINKLLKKIINHNLKSDLLFSINDSYIHYANVRSRLKTILKNTPHHNLTIHDLRHIHSSLLLYNKVDLKSISTHLGHSSIRITSDIYLHTAHEASEQLSINIENIFNNLKK